MRLPFPNRFSVYSDRVVVDAFVRQRFDNADQGLSFRSAMSSGTGLDIGGDTDPYSCFYLIGEKREADLPEV